MITIELLATQNKHLFTAGINQYKINTKERVEVIVSYEQLESSNKMVKLFDRFFEI